MARRPHGDRRSLGAGALIPQLTTAERWPFVCVGIGFGALAVAFVVYGSWRHRAVEEALLRDEFPRVHRWVILVFAALGVSLSLLTILAILIVL